MENYEILPKLKNEHPGFYRALTGQMSGGACPWAFGLRERECNGQIRCSECWQQAMERARQQAMAEPQFPEAVRTAMFHTLCGRE